MAKCTLCGAETILFVLGTPLCVKCDDELEREKRKKEEAEKGKKPERR